MVLTIASPSLLCVQSAKVTKNKQIVPPVARTGIDLGVVQKDVRIGSTQDEVAVALGSPNIVTKMQRKRHLDL